MLCPQWFIFAFIYGLKALTKHAGFWYLAGWGESVGIVGLPRNICPWKYNFFFSIPHSAMESSKRAVSDKFLVY